MRVPLEWLREYVDVTMPVAELAERTQQAFACVFNLNILEQLHAAFDLARHYCLQRIPINERLFPNALVEIERFLQVGKDTEIINHYAGAFLHRWQWAIRPSDGLEEIVIPQRLIEIHHLLYRRVETSQQPVAYDQYL